MTLTRLYKFILKRTIGKYLENELLIEQLQVISREGIVKLKNLKFNVNLINEEYFQLLPFRLVSCTVTELEVHVAYQTILTESCKFTVNGAKIEFELNASSSTTMENGAVLSTAETGTSSVSVVDDNVSEDSQKGLSFIAHWIEIVVARLQITLKNTSIVFRATQDSLSLPRRDTELQVNVSLVEYFNTDPSIFSSEESSVAMSARLAQSSTGASMYNSAQLARKLGSKKVRDV